MPFAAIFQKDAAIKRRIAQAPLYTRPRALPGEGKAVRFVGEMLHFSRVLGLAKRRVGGGAARLLASYAIDLKKEYGADLFSGGSEPAANALAHYGMLAGMNVRSDLLLLSRRAKAGLAAHSGAIKRKCSVAEIGLGVLAAVASFAAGYACWHWISASGGQNYATFAAIASPAIALALFVLLYLLISNAEDHAVAAARSKEPSGWNVRCAAIAWEEVERLASRQANTPKAMP